MAFCAALELHVQKISLGVLWYSPSTWVCLAYVISHFLILCCERNTHHNWVYLANNGVNKWCNKSHIKCYGGAEEGAIVSTRRTREGHRGMWCLSQKLVGVEGKEACFRLRAKAQWHHMRDVVREATFRPRGWSSWRWEVLWWMAPGREIESRSGRACWGGWPLFCRQWEGTEGLEAGVRQGQPIQQA